MRFGRIVAPFILLDLPFCQQAQKHSFKDPACVQECLSLMPAQNIIQEVTEQEKCFGAIVYTADLNRIIS